METKRQVQVKVDGYTRFCMTAIAVLLTVLVIGLWADAVPSPAPAHGAEPKVMFGDKAADREEMLKAQKDAVEKLQDLITLLKSGDVKVQVTNAAGPGTGGANDKPKE